MKQSDTSLRDFEIVYGDENGQDISKVFSVDEEVLDYIEFIEELLEESLEKQLIYRTFFCQHFANMTHAN